MAGSTNETHSMPGQTPLLDWAHPSSASGLSAASARPPSRRSRAGRTSWRARPRLISAPTGSGKTLAAFLACIDRLVRKALAGELAGPHRSPLRLAAEGAGQRHPEESRAPLGEILQLAGERGLLMPEIRTAVRTGDTLMHERRAMLDASAAHSGHHARIALHPAHGGKEPRNPAHRRDGDRRRNSRRRRRQARRASGAFARTPRSAASGSPPMRIGLSATQKPIELVAQFLAGSGRPEPVIVDIGNTAPARSRRRSARERTWAGRLERNVGRNLRPHRRAGQPASLDAGLRQHAAAGRARGASSGRACSAKTRWPRTTAACRASCGSPPKRS